MSVRARLVAVALSGLASVAAHSQGIPVIDVANLVQAIQQVMNDVTKINNQVQQLTQLREQVRSINGFRGLGTVLDDPRLHNYVPTEAYNVVNGVNTTGYSGLSATAKALRDAAMIYNCGDVPDTARPACQARLALPYQQKGLLQDAMKAAAGRVSQISALMNQINATADQKAVQEIQARIGAENALLAHEISQLQMLQGLADSEERIARSRERERQYEMLGRTGRIADYLP